MERAVASWISPLAWESGLSCEGLLSRSSSARSRRRDKDVTGHKKDGKERVLCKHDGCHSLTWLQMAQLPLVVLLLQLNVDPGPLWHPTCSTVAGHSDRLP